MSREQIISGVVAVLCHAALLFGFRMGNLARPLPMSDEPIEVSLVAGEPAPAAPEVAPAPPPPPPPAPVPEPIPEPPSKPEPPPEPMAKPEPSAPPPHREPPKPQRPAVAQRQKTAPASANIGTATSAAPANATGAASGHGSTTARPHFNPKPPYPAEARRLRQEGRVLLAVTVSADGRATSVSIARSSGVAALDESAEATVRRWTFEPARVAGVAVASRAEVPVTFKLAE